MAAKKKRKEQSTVERFERAVEKSTNARYQLRLFVSGITPRSLEAIERVRAVCEEYMPGRYQLEVIDIYKEPLAAKENQIVAAPTLIKQLPLPVRKFVGSMVRNEDILKGLDIKVIK